jgi:uncharacterized protein involved in tolerance to divalent cations
MTEIDETINDTLTHKSHEMYDFISTSMPDKLPEIISYVDIENGNTIYHELVKECAVDRLKQMFADKSININVTNKHNQTPIDYINNIVVARLFIKNLNEQLIINSEQINIIKQEQKLLNKQFNQLKRLSTIVISAVIVLIISYFTKMIFCH